MKKIAAILFALLFNCTTGALGAAVLGVSPVIGMGVMNGVAVASSAFNLMPSGVALSGLYTEVWTGHMSKKFRTDPEGLGWYSKIRSYDQYVENDVIHFVNIGGDPTVLVNNTSYPIGVEDLPDADKPISLDKYQTKATRITDDELYAISYDKMKSVVERHHEAISEQKYSRALHAISPTKNSDETPVIKTTGDQDADGRKIMTRKDIVAMKKKFDKLNVPKNDRILVLCADHIADLLEHDQKFANQHYNETTGKVNKLYGFEIYEYNDCPYYDSSLEKVAFGAVPTATDAQASIAFAAVRMMKANGSTKTYLSEAKNNPETQENLINFRTYSICLPLREEAMGAIVSDIS